MMADLLRIANSLKTLLTLFSSVIISFYFLAHEFKGRRLKKSLSEDLKRSLRKFIQDHIEDIDRNRAQALSDGGISLENLKSLTPIHPDSDVYSVIGGGKPLLIFGPGSDVDLKQWLSGETRAAMRKAGVNVFLAKADIIDKSYIYYYNYQSIRTIFQENFEFFPIAIVNQVNLNQNDEMSNDQIDKFLETFIGKHMEGWSGKTQEATVLFGILLGYGKQNAENFVNLSMKKRIGLADLMSKFQLTKDSELGNFAEFAVSLENIEIELAENLNLVLKMKMGVNTYHEVERVLKEKVGGIDLNNLDMQTSGEATRFEIPASAGMTSGSDPAMLNQPIFGLTPKIIYIGPVNAYQFLGLNDAGEPDSNHADSSPDPQIPELSFTRKE